MAIEREDLHEGDAAYESAGAVKKNLELARSNGQLDDEKALDEKFKLWNQVDVKAEVDLARGPDSGKVAVIMAPKAAEAIQEQLDASEPQAVQSENYSDMGDVTPAEVELSQSAVDQHSKSEKTEDGPKSVGTLMMLAESFEKVGAIDEAREMRQKAQRAYLAHKADQAALAGQNVDQSADQLLDVGRAETIAVEPVGTEDAEVTSGDHQPEALASAKADESEGTSAEVVNLLQQALDLENDSKPEEAAKVRERARQAYMADKAARAGEAIAVRQAEVGDQTAATHEEAGKLKSAPEIKNSEKMIERAREAYYAARADAGRASDSSELIDQPKVEGRAGGDETKDIAPEAIEVTEKTVEAAKAAGFTDDLILRSGFEISGETHIPESRPSAEASVDGDPGDRTTKQVEKSAEKPDSRTTEIKNPGVRKRSASWEKVWSNLNNQ